MLMFSPEWHDAKDVRLRGVVNRPAPAEPKPAAEPRPTSVRPVRRDKPTSTLKPSRGPFPVLEDGDCPDCGGDGFFLTEGVVEECKGCDGLGTTRQHRQG